MDLPDFDRLQRCFTGDGPAPPTVCLRSVAYYHDFDGDRDVDLDDYETGFYPCSQAEEPDARCLAIHDFDTDSLSDGSVDMADYGGFVDCSANGSGQAPPESCLRSGFQDTPPAAGTFALHGRPIDVLSDGHVLIYVRNRYYGPKHSRWVQRDPTEYTDGRNLYEAFANNALRNVDPEGLWIIDRSGGAQATAEAELLDTIQSLAKTVGLDVDEWAEWLDVPSGRIYTDLQGELSIHNPQFDKCTEIWPGEEVLVPNTVIAYWGGELGGFGRFWVMWGHDQGTLAKRGFAVVEMKHKTAAKFESEIERMMRAKSLHGLFYWGHGTRQDVTTDSDKMRTPLGWLYSTKYERWHPHYRMALGILFACDTAAAKERFSPDAIFWGKEGRLWPHGFHLFGPTIDKLVPPGAQGTRE